MQKYFVVLLVWVMVVGGFHQKALAQDQALSQGNILVEGYYGFPNFATFLLRSAYGLSGSDENVNIGGLGPLGARVEYMIDDNIGLGVEVYYGASSVEWNEANLNPTQGDPDNYFYSVDYNRLSINIRGAYHFPVSSNLDAYVLGGVGYRGTTYKFDTNDPAFQKQTVGNLFPLSYRLGAGGRYFIADAIGIGLEFALGDLW